MLNKTLPLAFSLLVLYFQSFLSFCALVCAGDLYSVMSTLLGQSQDVAPVHKYNPSQTQRAQAELVAQIDSLIQKKDLGFPRLAFQTRVGHVLVRDRVHKFHQLEATTKSPRSKLLAEGGSWMCTTSSLFSFCVPVFSNCNTLHML